MNLIEKLGGYVQAKALRELPASTYDCGVKFNREELERSMLEHRRENNIFEVGDKVVLIGYMKDDSSDILIVNSIGKYDLSFFSRDDLHINTIHSFSVVVRHATLEEIKAEHRL